MQSGILCEVILVLGLFVLEDVVAHISSDSVRRCYDCQDTFKEIWTPYTMCQSNVTAVPIASCLVTENFCKVERVSVKGVTISLTRSCAENCYYGCHFYGFGVTQLRCTTCCSMDLCNTGSGTESVFGIYLRTSLRVLICVVVTLMHFVIVQW